MNTKTQNIIENVDDKSWWENTKYNLRIYIWVQCALLTALRLWFWQRSYLIPQIESLYTKLTGSKFYSKIDCSNGYHQILTDPEPMSKPDPSKIKILRTRDRHHGWRRMKRCLKTRKLKTKNYLKGKILQWIEKIYLLFNINLVNLIIKLTFGTKLWTGILKYNRINSDQSVGAICGCARSKLIAEPLIRTCWYRALNTIFNLKRFFLIFFRISSYYQHKHHIAYCTHL